MSVVRLTVSILVIVTAGASISVAATEDEGYANCGLQHLDMCQDSNQLFWGPAKGGQSVRKDEFRKALSDFLENAPPENAGRFSGTPALTAEEAMMGPGGPPVKLPTGELFISGFTPHFAPQKGAAVLTPDGRIVFIAVLSASPAMSPAERRPEAYRHVLKVYVHNRAPAAELLAYVRAWAAKAVDGLFNYPGTPKDSFAGIELWTRADTTKKWSLTMLP